VRTGARDPAARGAVGAHPTCPKRNRYAWGGSDPRTAAAAVTRSVLPPHRGVDSWWPGGIGRWRIGDSGPWVMGMRCDARGGRRSVSASTSSRCKRPHSLVRLRAVPNFQPKYARATQGVSNFQRLSTH
jgi:hypothetical protein